MLVVDIAKKQLYELYQLRQNPDGTWIHEGAAFWDLTTNAPRGTGYVDSADVGGFAILPGLVRMDEINNGVIPHAMRITLHKTLNGYVSPSTHSTYNWVYDGPPTLIPMGARLRLKQGFDLSKYNKVRRAIIVCLLTYGAFVADNGTNFAITADNDDAAFKAVLGGQF